MRLPRRARIAVLAVVMPLLLLFLVDALAHGSWARAALALVGLGFGASGLLDIRAERRTNH